MDWQQYLPAIITGIISFVSGLGLAVSKGLSKAVEDIWTDYRASRKHTKQRKREIVNQLLFDIPRGKSHHFENTRDSREWEYIISQIAIYDKPMSKRVAQFLYLWKKHIVAKQQYDKHGSITIIGSDDEPVTRGPDYLEELQAQLYEEYDEIIDLLGSWQK